jgi:hypothetical protein
LEGLVRLSSWVPFRRATALLAELTGVQVSEATARRWTEEAGVGWEEVQTAQAEQIRHDLPEPDQPVERLLMSADGAFVPLVRGEWAEVKLLVLGEVRTTPAGHPETTALSYFAQLAEAETFSQAAIIETHRRGLERAEAVCAVLDGAEWLQGLVDDHRADAVRILDFAHAAEYISQIGQAVAQAGTTLPATWLTDQLHTLKHEGPPKVLADLRELAVSHPALEAVQEALRYLEKRVPQMQYPHYQAAGWPIGSGSVESGHKVVMQARLKGPGMHWARHHVNPMLVLRTAECNERWAEAWAHVSRWQADQRRWRRRQRATLRLLRACWLVLDWHRRFGRWPPQPEQKPLAPSEPEKEASGALISRRPAATHPWRRPLLHRRRLAAN